MGTGQPVVALGNQGEVTAIFTSDSLAEGNRAVAGKISASSAGGPCTENATTLCLSHGRFSVNATWQDFQGGTGRAQVERLTDDTGYFWFFDQANVEIIIKVLDACSFANNFWVFAGGLTSVAVEITVTDTQTGQSQHYSNALNTPFAPVQDTEAFSVLLVGSTGRRSIF